MRKYLKIVVLAFSVHCTVLHAQVSMMANSPDRSAALDARQSGRGLLVPNISLQHTSDVSVINGSSPVQYLLVYNTNANITGAGATGTGFYYWEGSIWKKLITSANMNDSTWHLQGNNGANAQNFIGTTDNNDLVVKTNNTERLRVTSGGRIGIGTTNPQYNLEVQGDTKIGGGLFVATASRAPQTGVAQMARDNTTGQVYTVTSSSGNLKSFNYVKYSIDQVKEDQLTDFDTKISSVDYTVMVVGSSFSHNIAMKMQPGYNGTFAYQMDYAFVSGGTWHLRADYVGGTTYDNGNGKWDFYCLVINNALVNQLPDQVLNMQGNTTGSFSAPPSGL